MTLPTKLETGLGSAFEHWRARRFNFLLNALFVSVMLNSFFAVIVWRLINR